MALCLQVVVALITDALRLRYTNGVAYTEGLEAFTFHARCLLESVLDGAAVALHGLGDLTRMRTDAGEAGLDGARTAAPLLALTLRLARLHIRLVAQR